MQTCAAGYVFKRTDGCEVLSLCYKGVHWLQYGETCPPGSTFSMLANVPKTRNYSVQSKATKSQTWRKIYCSESIVL